MRLIPRPWKFNVLSRVLGGSRAARSLGVRVGQGCRIYSCRVASEYWMVKIGNRTTVSVDVLFITHDGTGWLARDEQGRRYRYAPISVGDDSFVGARATIMPGVNIGDHVVVAAGAVVTKSVPSGAVVAGVPARIVGSTECLIAKQLDWATEQDRKGDSYQAKVQSVAEEFFVPQLRWPSD